jgi:hypothetical protein
MYKSLFSLIIFGGMYMNKTLPIYLLSGIIGLISLYGGLSGQKILFVNNARTASITLAVVGFIMCSTGALAPFINKAPVHPLSLAGYILGVLALTIALIQIFNWNVPIFGVPRYALISLGLIIVVKIIIARFGFIFK